MTISYRGGKNYRKLHRYYFFSQGNGPVRKDTGEIEDTEEDREYKGFFFNLFIFLVL